MTDLASRLLVQLKDYATCNDDLAINIRKTVLEPFQVDVTRLDSIRKPPPTPARFKQMATQLAPIAMRIVNQNIEALIGLKRARTSNYTVAVNCLVDTSFYALSALRHMNAFTTLKPLDLEKTTSNLICKMVELGEYNRALDELLKFRSLLASVAKVELSSISSRTSKSPSSTQSITPMKGVLTESFNKQPSFTIIPRQNIAPEPIIKNQWEDDMLNKYADLFHFPLDHKINDRTMILLVLAYQMNTIRCWCELQDGALSKYIPYFMERSGNFIDWCQHLIDVDSQIAKKQLDTLQKLLYKVANKLPLTEEAAYHSHNIQVVALRALALSGSVPLKLVLDRMVRIGITYEKSTKQTSYSHLQKCCKEFLEKLTLDVNNFSEMDSYFVLCEYSAYVSRKAKSYKGAFYAYKDMVRPLRDIIKNGSSCSYYYAAYAANAKLALGSVQMDKMVLDDTFADITTTLNESIACLSLISSSTVAENQQPHDEHVQQALYNLCKSIEGFRLSCKRLFEFISDKAKQALLQRREDPFKTPPRQEDLVTPSDFGQWNSIVTYMNNTLQQCSETLLTNLSIAKEEPSDTKRSTTQNDIMASFIDVMILLGRMQFNIQDEDSFSHAYEYLSTAEQICAEKKYTTGYRWLSGSYYNLGTTMIKAEMYSHAIYPLRKSSSMLEKDIERASSNEGQLQLCKRYEILGICCQKTKRFDDAISAFRFALKRIPVSEIEQFVSKSDKTAVATVMEQEPLIPKLIDRFLRASVIDPDQESIHFASEHIALSTINSIQRCFIYECELKVWHALSVKMKLFKYELFIIERLLGVYDSDNFPLRRARVLLSRVQIERNKPADRDECTKAALACAKEASSLLKVQDYAQDTNLLNYRRHYLALSNSWMAICNRELKELPPNAFVSALQQWGILLKKITPIYYRGDSSKIDIKQVYDEIDDLDQFYDHMRMLADLFGVTGERIHQICALRILLKLNNGLRDVQVDHISESIILSSTIGKLYCDLGYTGKAAIEFRQAKNAVSSKPCSNRAELVYRVNYSYYLACIGDYDTSKEVFNATKIVWQNTPMADQKDPITTVKSYTTRCMLLADIYSTLSLIQANTEDLDCAIDSATASLQLLNKCIQIIQKSQEKVQQQQEAELEDPFNSPPPEQQEARKMIFRESQWLMAQKTSNSLHTLAQLLIKKGSPNEAKYFIKQAPLLAEKVGSSGMLFDAHLDACDFYLRYGDVSKSQDALENAMRLNEEPVGLAQVKLKVAMAQLAVANEYYDIALETYDEANELLVQLSTEEEINILEKLIDANEDYKRSRVTFADQVDDSDKFDCLPLQQLLMSNTIYKAIALADKGQVEDALDLLDSFEGPSLSASSEIELIASVGHLRLLMMRQDFSMRSEQRLLFNEAVALPAMKTQLSRGSLIKKPTIDHELRAMRDSLTQSVSHMSEANRNGWSRERPPTIERLCKETSYAMILNHQMSCINRTIANDCTLFGSYYLSMANGINMRREMQYCLGIKLNQSFVGHAPSDKEWPMSFEEKQTYYDRLARISHNPSWLERHLKTLQELYQEEPELNDAAFQAKFVDILPSNWTVCSLSLDIVNGDLYMVQLRSKEPPFAVKIPLDRTQHRPGNSNNDYDILQYADAVAELKDIIQGSDETITNSANCHQTSQIEAWWNTRKNLDARLKKLMENIENRWLSGFKGLLTGRYREYKEELIKFQKAMNDITFKAINNATATKVRVELSLAFCRTVVRLGRHSTHRDLEDVAYFALSCYEVQNIQVNYTKIDFEKLIEDIRLLVSRYHERCTMAGVESSKNIPNDHVILIVDKHLQMFPLESMPILRPQSASRLPCLSFLRDRILYTQSHNTKEAYDDFGLTTMSQWTDLTVSKRSAFYVLNPGGDLKDTQREFEPIFKNVPEWDGVIGSVPMELQCKVALQSRDIYMYFGHSAGQAFMRGTTVRQLSNCAVSLLMGCSSGILEANGEFDLNGYVLNYLLAGSPAVVANLWDVTDRSIDKLTKFMLNSWGMLKKPNQKQEASQTNKSLVQAVCESRNQCKLSYLIGAAPVVYGIPVYLNNTE